jgi:hypothetical protein
LALRKWYKANCEPIASPSGLIWEISNIFSDNEKRFDNSLVYLDKSITFATLFFRFSNIGNNPEG